MLDVMLGWYMKEAMNSRYATITFAQTIPPSSELEIHISDAESGSKIQSKLDGYNFIVTDIYVYCTPGTTNVKISPDSDEQKSFTLLAYEPARPPVMPPVVITADVDILYTNNDTMSNDVYLTFNGFWISEDKMADLSVMSQIMAEGIYKIEEFTAVGVTKISGILELVELIATDYLGLDISSTSSSSDDDTDTDTTTTTRSASLQTMCRRRR